MPTWQGWLGDGARVAGLVGNGARVAPIRQWQVPGWHHCWREGAKAAPVGWGMVPRWHQSGSGRCQAGTIAGGRVARRHQLVGGWCQGGTNPAVAGVRLASCHGMNNLSSSYGPGVLDPEVIRSHALPEVSRIAGPSRRKRHKVTRIGERLARIGTGPTGSGARLMRSTRLTKTGTGFVGIGTGLTGIDMRHI